MLSILPVETSAEALRVPSEPQVPEKKPVEPTFSADEISHPEIAPVEEPSEEKEEFEIVLGRMQVASVLFVAVVALVVFSSLSYVTGRALGPKPVQAAPAPAAAVPAPPPVVPEPMPVATVVKPDFPLAEPEPAPVPETPVFSHPSPNAVYLQMGAVEKGVAVIMVDGLRKRGFAAFAAPGPTEVIFRVLIGPLPDAEAFRKTKEKVDQIGLNSFARKYQP